ncbi:amidase [Gordonia desulfuricans]|uniref:amidase n=1 Tax=Gordonia desulfuricans TaxID=89051 RepID=A0A7K3LSF8_9ACTN|nr:MULTISPECIES: amidase [Gordonia]KOY49811.1 indole acetimide hydrolase [Gordonia sp. NB41Y]NDK91142.1 amidase [Gordonia desulfuricans]WLP88638.1 amidase [Gordonia sp. NB41Y]
MNTDHWSLPLGDQAAAVRDGVLSARDLVTQTREQIAGREPDLAAWVTLSDSVVDDAGAIDARAVDARPGDLPLCGISVGVKDLIDVAGLPTRAGSVTTSDRPAASDAACIARLRELGAVIQGKTVTTEYGYFAPGPTRNPHALDHTPGGSSSGSAAAVGAGTVLIALGTQTAGSLTRPASYCGVAGMVLAQGSASLAGVTGMSETLDSLGILTRTVDDLHYVYSAFTGDPASASGETAGTEVLMWRGSDLGVLDPAMLDLIESLPAILSTAGLGYGRLEWDDAVRTLSDDHSTVMSYEASRRLAPVHTAQSESLSPQLRALLDDGRLVRDSAHRDALDRRDLARTELFSIIGDNAVIVGPAALGPAPAGLDATGSPILSRPWQLLGLPVVVVPGARDDQGLPLGLQVIGRPGREAQLFEVARRLEAALQAERTAAQ